MKRVLILLLLVPLLPSLAAAGDPVRVVIYPVIRLASAGEAPADTMPLGKLARIVADRETRRELQAVEVPVRTLRGADQLDGKQLMRLLAALPALAGAEILGPDHVSVAAARDSDLSERATEAAAAGLRKHVETRWPGRYRNLELRALGEDRALTLRPGSRVQLDFTALERIRRRTPLWLVIEEQGRSRRVVLWFEVSGEFLAWEALGTLDARAAAAQGEFAERWRNLAELNRGDPALPSADHRLVARMNAGEILTEQHLEPIPAVDFGTDTRVISRVGTVEIQTIATALESAFVGDLIDLRSKSSEQRFEARVLDHNLVRIERASPWGEAQVETRQ